ncbi:MAG TPA: class I SAM-dependent methyltransferase [Bryobacteraceae bacterium]
MERSFLHSYLEAFKTIEGWFSYDAALLFMAYNELLSQCGVAGDVLEIGVHHGLSAIAVASLCGDGNCFYAVDLFERMQGRNVSNSGSGHRGAFERNLKRFYPDTSFLHVISGPSTALNAGKLGTRFSFCHIDGGHSREETYHDIKLCHSILMSGGILALDDYFNPQFPGVSEGAVQFLLGHPDALQPLAIGYQKVLFQKLPAPRDLNQQFRMAFPQVGSKTVQLWDQPTLLISDVLRSHIDLQSSTPKRLVRLGAVPRAKIDSALPQVDAPCGEPVRLPVTVTNVSSEVFPAGEGVFGLSYHLLSASGEVLSHDNERAWLMTSLKPGESQNIYLPVHTPSQAGAYQLEIDLVWEQVMWFKDVGNPTELVPLRVQ